MKLVPVTCLLAGVFPRDGAASEPPSVALPASATTTGASGAGEADAAATLEATGGVAAVTAGRFEATALEPLCGAVSPGGAALFSHAETPIERRRSAAVVTRWRRIEASSYSSIRARTTAADEALRYVRSLSIRSSSTLLESTSSARRDAGAPEGRRSRRATPCSGKARTPRLPIPVRTRGRSKPSSTERSCRTSAPPPAPVVRRARAARDSAQAGCAGPGR